MDSYKQEDFFGESNFDVKAFLQKLLRNWYFFAVSLPICFAAAVVHLYLAKPIYKVKSTMLIYNDGGKGKLSENKYLEGGIKLFGGDQNIQNEIGIIKSFNLIKQPLKELDFEVSYFTEKNFKTKEYYKRFPFEVLLDRSEYQLLGKPIYINILSKDRYEVSIDTEDYSLYKPEDGSIQQFKDQEFIHKEICEFGELCQNDNYSFRLYLEEEHLKAAAFQEAELSFKVHSLTGLADAYIGKINIRTLDLESTILEIFSEGPVVQKEVDFLNALMRAYGRNRLEEKNSFADGTIAFIDRQLSAVSDTLAGVEQDIAQISIQGQTLDLEASAADKVEDLRQLKNELARLELKRKYYNALLKYLSDSDNMQSIPNPSAMGIGDQVLNTLILDLKGLFAERAELAFKSSGSPELAILDRKIENARESLTENVRSLISSSEITIEDMNDRIAVLEREVRKLPNIAINRDKFKRIFELNDNLFNYLQQRRAEAEIAKAANTADSKILDTARQVGRGPIAPQKFVILFAAIFAGLAIPTLILLGQDYLNDRVTDANQIESRTRVPVLAKIARGDKGEGAGLINYDNLTSHLAESLRYLKVNLQYIASDRPRKVIGITSNIPGEGKTFCALNLASILAVSGQNTVVIGADIRKPKLFERSQIKNEIGLSSYLIHQAAYEEIIQNSDLDNLDIIPSGPVPPNPAELLESPKFNTLLETLKQTYDYIIIDTPPVGLVSDFLILAKYMDLSLYVVRQNYTKQETILDIEKLKQKNKLPNLYIIFNDVKSFGKKYGEYAMNYRKKSRYKQNGQYIKKKIWNKS